MTITLLTACVAPTPPIAEVTPFVPDPAEPSEITNITLDQPTREPTIALAIPTAPPSDAYPAAAELPPANDAYPYPAPEDGDLTLQVNPTIDAIVAETLDNSGINNASVNPNVVPSPMFIELGPGEARRQAFEFDQALAFEPVNDPSFYGLAPANLYFQDFFVDYQDYDPYLGEPPTISDKLYDLDGQQVVIEGYMSPPLKLGLDWFMLTRFPLGFCPFHSTAATITPDIALIYLDGAENLFTYDALRIVGELHVGEAVDPETGMVSLARVYAEEDGLEIIPFGQ